MRYRYEDEGYRGEDRPYEGRQETRYGRGGWSNPRSWEDRDEGSYWQGRDIEDEERRRGYYGRGFGQRMGQRMREGGREPIGRRDAYGRDYGREMGREYGRDFGPDYGRGQSMLGREYDRDWNRDRGEWGRERDEMMGYGGYGNYGPYGTAGEQGSMRGYGEREGRYGYGEPYGHGERYGEGRPYYGGGRGSFGEPDRDRSGMGPRREWRGEREEWRGRGGGAYGEEGLGERVMRGIRHWFGLGPKGYRRSDDRIREDVCDRLVHLAQHADVDSSDVEVIVRDGEVTLAGTIRERRWKHLLEDVADSVPGVRDVHNQLRVKREAREGAESPEERRGTTGATANNPMGTQSQADRNGPGMQRRS